MKKITILTALNFCSLFAFSQGIYKPGLVVKNAGDTLKGWINYGDWRANPAKIEFRTDLNNPEVVEYTTNDIGYFEITGRDAYKRASVTKDMRSVNTAEISSATTDTVQTSTVFLRVLVRGKKLSLYEFMDFKYHYFLQAGEDTVEELSYKLYINSNAHKFYMDGVGTIVSEWNHYRDQLREYEDDKHPPSLDREIDNAEYSATKLSRIVIELNGKEQVSAYGEENNKSKVKPQFFVSAGAGLSTPQARGNASDASILGLNFKSTVNPVLSVGIDLLSSRNFNDFTFRFEISLSENTYKADKNSLNFYELPQYETYTVKQQNISPSLSAMYNFRRTRKVRYYVGLGSAYNIASYSKNRYTQILTSDPSNVTVVDDPINLEKYWPSVFLRAGARLGRKFEIGVTGNVYGAISDYSYFSLTPRIYSLKFVYFFL